MAKRGGSPKSEYGQQLAEKQKIRTEYGLREKQFRNYFDKGGDPDNIFALLESRLDSFAFRAGLAPTRRMARQMASHGHFMVNGRKVTIPSYHLRPNDEVEVKETSKSKGMFEDFELKTKNYEPPSWVKFDKKNKKATFKTLPDIKESTQPFSFQTVIEFYSR